MTQRGFISLSLMGWSAVAAGVVIMGLGVGLKIQSSRLAASQQEVATVKASFEVFKEGVRKAGEAQEAKNKETLKKRERINATALKSLQNRYSDLDSRYQRLRGQSADSGGGGLPPVPDATRPTDDAARDNRLLEILRHADQQTTQMMELQEWVKSQK